MERWKGQVHAGVVKTQQSQLLGFYQLLRSISTIVASWDIESCCDTEFMQVIKLVQIHLAQLLQLSSMSAVNCK